MGPVCSAEISSSTNLERPADVLGRIRKKGETTSKLCRAALRSPHASMAQRPERRSACAAGGEGCSSEAASAASLRRDTDATADPLASPAPAALRTEVRTEGRAEGGGRIVLGVCCMQKKYKSLTQLLDLLAASGDFTVVCFPQANTFVSSFQSAPV